MMSRDSKNPLRITLLTVIVTTLLSAKLCLAVQSETAPNDERPGSPRASCILRIPGNNVNIPLDEPFIQSVLMTSAVRGDAVRSVLHHGGSILLDNDYLVTDIEYIAGPSPIVDASSPTYFRMTVSTESGDPDGNSIPPVAEQIQAALVDRLRNALSNLSVQNAKSLRDMIAVSEQRLRDAKQHLDELRTKRKALSTSAGRIDLDRDKVLDEIAHLEAQLRDTEVERVSQHARQAAIEAQIAKTAERQAKQVGDDPVLPELQHLVDIQQSRFDRVEQLHKANQVSDSELQNARQALIEARVRMQERREARAAEVKGGDEARLNTELAELSIATAEVEARSGFIHERLQTLAKQLDLANQLQADVELAMPAAEEAVRSENERLQKLKTRFQTLQPITLDVVGEADGPAHKPRPER